ncbi:EAL domain-containing protein [Paenibacillus soyae]|uniref:EAL domain-containing protein n=1 Tax=Paenibacillus soyae TaxID=2969249 RepID=A0A9X2MQ77_9BACL|nr:EAL domain-containing protein [Paenibacillus soyae]MCR2804194.1 EAL domain-containing protein [Paenibacillus soyae]
MIRLQGNYDGLIMLLSFGMAFFTSYSALKFSDRLSRAQGKRKAAWLLLSGLVMGCGIWAAHSSGMLPLRLDYPSGGGGPSVAIFSILSGMMASLLAFYVTSSQKTTKPKLVAGSLAMGSGMAAAYHLEMASLESSVLQLPYPPLLAAASGLLAAAASYGALRLMKASRTSGRGRHFQAAAAGLMAAGICGMNVIGMAAARRHYSGITPLPDEPAHADAAHVLVYITAMLVVLAAVSWLAKQWERAALKRLAYTDPLTGLPNRNALQRFFGGGKHGTELRAVLMIDLDQFKRVNDRFGYDIGDLMIQEAGSRINQFAGTGRKVFRLEGDQFLVAARDEAGWTADELAEHILEELRRPCWIAGLEIQMTGSIGIGCAPRNGNRGAELVKTAHSALYYAKSQGQNRYSVYDPEMDKQLSRRMIIEKGLRSALTKGQLAVYYQPKWDTEMNQPVGFEALLRWRHPKLGAIGPDEFISIAEETGHIAPITEWVLEQACRDCSAWNAMTAGGLGVSVNLSSRLFGSLGLQDMVSRALERTGLPPGMLELEVTEAAVMNHFDHAKEQLARLQRSGVRISMDNFGSGFSFLGSIDKLSLQTLKLDRLYMREYESPPMKAIVNAIISLADQLKIQLVAEGVETERQLQFLRQAGCSVMQGYYFKKPMPRDELDEWLAGLSA